MDSPYLSHFGTLNIHGSIPDDEIAIAGAHRGSASITPLNSQEISTATPSNPSSSVPFRRDEDFIDRGDILARVDERCSRPAGRAALVGIGGIGKSQLAIEYSHRLRRRSPAHWVFWVHASNASRVEQAYKEIGRRVGLPQLSNTAETVQAVCGWLANEANGRWLMIVDNLDDEITINTGQDGQNISFASLLPQSDNGAVLITSRNSDVVRRLVNPRREIIPVDAMSEDEAEQLLMTKLGNSLRDGARQLVQELECIPLAVTHAASYIERLKPRMTILQYLDDISSLDARTTLLQQEAPDIRRDEQASKSVFATWAVSFEHIRTKQRSAADLLSFMSFFDPQGIPEFMIRHYTEGALYDGDEDEIEDGDDDDEDRNNEAGVFQEDIALLRAFSFIKATQRGEEYEMHRLVQQATRTWLETDQTDHRWRKHFIRAMWQEFPSVKFDNWPKCHTLYPHVLQMAEKGAFNDADTLKRAAVMQKAARFAWGKGLFKHAEEMVSEALHTQTELLGADDPSTLTSAHILCSVFRSLHKPGALAMHRQTLTARQRVLGSEHPDTLRSMNNLATVLRKQGAIQEAEEIYRNTLMARQRVLGLEHPDTLLSTHNLAYILYTQEKLEESGTMTTQVLEARQRVLGPAHPDTLRSYWNLAQILTCRHHFDEAAPLYERACQGLSVTLGDDHPHTQACRGEFLEMRALRAQPQNPSLPRRLKRLWIRTQ